MPSLNQIWQQALIGTEGDRLDAVIVTAVAILLWPLGKILEHNLQERRKRSLEVARKHGETRRNTW